MMSNIFREVKEVRDCGDLKLVLDSSINGKHYVVAILVIKFIIRDRKGDFTLCGKRGVFFEMSGLCRDCDISPLNEDNTYIGEPSMCKVIPK